MGKKLVGSKINLSCDCLGVSGGWTPAVHLFTQSGGKLKFREDDQVLFQILSIRSIKYWFL